MTRLSAGQHVEPDEVATYIEGSLAEPVRSLVELHLASCDDCRAEVAEVSQMAAALRARRRRRNVLIPAAGVAAAAILLMLSPAGQTRLSERREGPHTSTLSPRALSPVGLVDSLREVTWSSVPEADRYELRLLDSLGTVLWQHETGDTSIHVPSTVPLRSGSSYYWRVQATTGFNRATHSELVGFSVRRPRAP